jgi:hypothetical protein
VSFRAFGWALESFDAVGWWSVGLRPRGSIWRLVKPCGLGLGQSQYALLEDTFAYLFNEMDHISE